MMMRNSKFVKAITLLSFVFLLTGFVAYRSGTFDNFNDKSLSADRSSGMPVDSPPVKPIIMPSSKSGHVIRPNNQQKNSNSASQSPSQNYMPNQSVKTNQSASPAKKDTARKKVIMSSSKSGDIKRIDDKTNETNDPPVIMGSSKSAPVFIPKKDTAKKKK